MTLQKLTFFGTGFAAMPLSAHDLISPHSHGEYGPVGIGALLFTVSLVAAYGMWRKYHTDKQ